MNTISLLLCYSGVCHSPSLFPGFFRVFRCPFPLHSFTKAIVKIDYTFFCVCSVFTVPLPLPLLPRYFYFSKAPKNRIGEVLLAQAINEIGTKYFFMSFDYDGVGIEANKVWLFMLKNHKTVEKGTWKWKWAMEGYYQHLELGWSGSKTNLMSCLGLRISIEMSRRFNSKENAHKSVQLSRDIIQIKKLFSINFPLESWTFFSRFLRFWVSTLKESDLFNAFVLDAIFIPTAVFFRDGKAKFNERKIWNSKFHSHVYFTEKTKNIRWKWIAMTSKSA